MKGFIHISLSSLTNSRPWVNVSKVKSDLSCSSTPKYKKQLTGKKIYFFKSVFSIEVTELSQKMVTNRAFLSLYLILWLALASRWKICQTPRKSGTTQQTGKQVLSLHFTYGGFIPALWPSASMCVLVCVQYGLKNSSKLLGHQANIHLIPIPNCGIDIMKPFLVD